MLPGASVIAVHAPTGTRHEAFTRTDGRFDLLNAQVGPFVKTSRNADSESFLSVAGRSGRYNNIQIDGAVNNDLFGPARQGFRLGPSEVAADHRGGGNRRSKTRGCDGPLRRRESRWAAPHAPLSPDASSVHWPG